MLVFARRDVNNEAGCHKSVARRIRYTNLGDLSRPLKSLRGLSERSPFMRAILQCNRKASKRLGFVAMRSVPPAVAGGLQSHLPYIISHFSFAIDVQYRL